MHITLDLCIFVIFNKWSSRFVYLKFSIDSSSFNLIPINWGKLHVNVDSYEKHSNSNDPMLFDKMYLEFVIWKMEICVFQGGLIPCVFFYFCFCFPFTSTCIEYFLIWKIVSYSFLGNFLLDNYCNKGGKNTQYVKQRVSNG
jgi:hypothetical protein